MRIKIAGIQMSCTDSPERNLRKAAEMVEYALEGGANIIAFQQLFHLPWFPAEPNEQHFALAEDENGPAITMMKELAAKGHVVIVCPIFEKCADGRFYNAAYVIDADGTVAGKYRKVHVPDLPMWCEKYYFSHGDSFPVINTQFGRIGIQLCWDVFFPEGARILALNGAQIIIAPTAAAFSSHPRWERMISSAAFANGVFAFRINRVGGGEQQPFYGKSFLVNPYGEMVIEPTGRTDAVLLAEMDYDLIAEAREIWNFLGDRHPEHYEDLSKRNL